MAIFAGRVKNVPLDGRTAVNRSFMTGTNMAGIPQNIMGREYVRPVEDDGANHSQRVEYSARPRDGAS